MSQGAIFNYFELLFLASVPLVLVALIVSAVSALSGRRRRAVNILKVVGTYAVLYMAIAIAWDFIQPRDTIRLGDQWCLDHMCLTAETVQSVPGKPMTAYTIGLRISNSSYRVVQWAPHAWIYLIDDGGKLYPPDPDSSLVPLDIKLQPRQAVATSRTFHVPAGVKDLGLVAGHGGGSYCGFMNRLIIGAGSCMFNKPKMIRIAPPGGL